MLYGVVDPRIRKREGKAHEQEEDDDSSRGPVDSDAGGNYGGRTGTRRAAMVTDFSRKNLAPCLS